MGNPSTRFDTHTLMIARVFEKHGAAFVLNTLRRLLEDQAEAAGEDDGPLAVAIKQLVEDHPE